MAVERNIFIGFETFYCNVSTNFIIITFTFELCCLIYENSVTILQLWKIQVVSCINRIRIIKIIRSCRPLSVLAGNDESLEK